MSSEHRRLLLRFIETGDFNDSLAWLLQQGLVVFTLSNHEPVEFCLTPKGRVWLAGVSAFHPSGGVPA